MRRSKLSKLIKLLVPLVTFGILIILILLNAETISKMKVEKAPISRGLHQDVFVFHSKKKTTSEYINSDVKTSNFPSESLSKILANMSNRISSLERQFENTELQLFLSQPATNNYNFVYIHNPLKNCSSREINVLLVTTSVVINFHKREQKRTGNIGIYSTNSLNKVKLLFFLGLPKQGKYYKKHQQKVDKEAETYEDIVQQNFEDNFSNKKFTSVLMLKWALEFCGGVKYVIRADEEITFDIPALELALSKRSETMTNFVIRMKRDSIFPDAKWEDKNHPDAAHSSNSLRELQGYPISTAKLMYEAALRMEPILFEKTDIIEACAKQVHVPILTDPDFDFQFT